MLNVNRILHLDADLAYKTMNSPIGSLKLIASNDELLGVLFQKSKSHGQRGIDDIRNEPDHPILKETEKQLDEYFGGMRHDFDLPLGLHGTPFQITVWKELLGLSFGITTTYFDIAVRLGGKTKARPVGGAVGSNPMGIIIPCHRVLGKSGDLTGFGGGLDVKAFLLDHENK